MESAGRQTASEPEIVVRGDADAVSREAATRITAILIAAIRPVVSLIGPRPAARPRPASTE